MCVCICVCVRVCECVCACVRMCVRDLSCRLQDLNIYSNERTITVKGGLEACCSAEVEIMKKLREAYDNDVAAISVS